MASDTKSKDQKGQKNITVSCRLRPLLPSEESLPTAGWTLSEDSVMLNTSRRNNSERGSYEKIEETMMEATYGPDKTNEDVYAGYQYIVKEAVEDGLNGAILAYGQTGSGKTHSIIGYPQENEELADANKGIIALALEDIFRMRAEHQRIKVSYIELYMEKINDLLGRQENLLCKEDVSSPNGGFKVDGLQEREPTSAKEILSWLNKAEKKRRVSTTRYNEKSSRSHTILQLQIITDNPNDENNPEEDGLSITTVSKLLIVDLAGNERLDEHTAYINESNSINKSLFFLGEVIQRLSKREEEVQFIPYRNSKLTSMLSVHLGQNSNTALLVTLHPLEEFIEQNLGTLRFAQKASKIKCEVRPVLQSKELMVILKQRKIIEELREQLKNCKTLPGAQENVYVSSSKDLDEIVCTLHQNAEVLKRDKETLHTAIKHIGYKLEKVAKKWEGETSLALPVPKADSLARIERCLEYLQEQKKNTHNLPNDRADISTREPTPTMPNDRADISTREPTPTMPTHCEEKETVLRPPARLYANCTGNPLERQIQKQHAATLAGSALYAPSTTSTYQGSEAGVENESSLGENSPMRKRPTNNNNITGNITKPILQHNQSWVGNATQEALMRAAEKKLREENMHLKANIKFLNQERNKWKEEAERRKEDQEKLVRQHSSRGNGESLMNSPEDDLDAQVEHAEIVTTILNGMSLKRGREQLAARDDMIIEPPDVFTERSHRSNIRDDMIIEPPDVLTERSHRSNIRDDMIIEPPDVFTERSNKSNGKPPLPPHQLGRTQIRKGKGSIDPEKAESFPKRHSESTIEKATPDTTISGTEVSAAEEEGTMKWSAREMFLCSPSFLDEERIESTRSHRHTIEVNRQPPYL